MLILLIIASFSLFMPSVSYSSTIMKSSYALATGRDDEERLTILNEIHNTFTLSKLSLSPGLQVLTLGCGIGLLEQEISVQISEGGFILATDVNLDQLELARAGRDEKKIDHLEFSLLDILNISEIPGVFDRIHCRFVLTHMAWDKIEVIIPRLYDKLAPGGFLLMEEIASMDCLYCEPPHKGYEQWKRIVASQFASQQSDLFVGKKIQQFLTNNGYIFDYSSYQPILKTSREKKILSLGVLSLKKRLIAEQFHSESEIDEIMKSLSDLENDSSVFPRYGEVNQIRVYRFQN